MFSPEHSIPHFAFELEAPPPPQSLRPTANSTTVKRPSPLRMSHFHDAKLTGSPTWYHFPPSPPATPPKNRHQSRWSYQHHHHHSPLHFTQHPSPWSSPPLPPNTPYNPHPQRPNPQPRNPSPAPPAPKNPPPQKNLHLTITPGRAPQHPTPHLPPAPPHLPTILPTLANIHTQAHLLDKKITRARLHGTLSPYPTPFPLTQVLELENGVNVAQSAALLCPRPVKTWFVESEGLMRGMEPH
ncbi:hypothetical protein CC80DRAFT_534560 [Byssothecium circinans]|uniref:Uncharacterized protein n=1 Tax=Byssothecium circinans TaxID=147558 RepID=A0A6A5U053_9PLEO|nr:hypothetical protein CC80DRAFT_534560 [Byssothecium circinans]